MKLGAFFTCYDELEATRFSLYSLRFIYPETPIFLVYESDVDFKRLEKELPNLVTHKEEDTLSKCFQIQPYNFLQPENQQAIRKAAWAVLDRLNRAIEYLQTDYVIMLDPDAVVRGPLTIPQGVGLLGSRVNTNAFVLSGLSDVLVKYGGIRLAAWGATPAIFNSEKFLKGFAILRDNPKIFEEMCASFYAMFAHDVLLPSVFSLIREPETFNPDIVECIRNPQWMQTDKPLLHQYKKYYPKRQTVYATSNWNG